MKLLCNQPPKYGEYQVTISMADVPSIGMLRCCYCVSAATFESDGMIAVCVCRQQTEVQPAWHCFGQG